MTDMAASLAAAFEIDMQKGRRCKAATNRGGQADSGAEKGAKSKPPTGKEERKKKEKSKYERSKAEAKTSLGNLVPRVLNPQGNHPAEVQAEPDPVWRAEDNRSPVVPGLTDLLPILRSLYYRVIPS